MKWNSILVTFAVAVLASSVSADETWPNVEYLGGKTLLYVHGETLTKLELVPARAKSYGTELVLSGRNSELIIDELRPVFRASLDRKVAKNMRLFRFKQRKERRTADIATPATTTQVGMRNLGIRMRIEEIGEGQYSYQPQKPLKPGEYGFVEEVLVGSWVYKSSKYRVASFTIRGSLGP